MKRPLLLSGFMATGKSTVGKIVAKLAECDFYDLDAEVVKAAGLSIQEIFSQQGEETFRQLESQTLTQLLEASKPCVISLGGGALLDRFVRIEALSKAVVVTLEASEEVILRRAAEDSGAERPLLADQCQQLRVKQLLSSRRLAYRESHAQISTDLLEPHQVALEALQVWERDEIAVAAGDASYCVSIGAGKIRSELERMTPPASGFLVVTDQNVEPLYAERVEYGLREFKAPKARVVLTPGEEHKHLEALSAVFDCAFDARLDRKGLMLGLGGGVTTDMTGFAAASWVRGIRWIGLPTTLLSMVDASTGGKTGVDFKTAKNSVGAFWQPVGVICDVETLLTETERAYTGAMSEVIKTALIGDPGLFELLEEKFDKILARDLTVMTEVVERCVRVKARVVSLDEREGSVRAHLNLGHTIGHALESSGGYSALTHGEAVSLGLVAALRLGVKLGHTSPDLLERSLHLMKRLKLPIGLERPKLEVATALLGLDKKRAGAEVRFVFVKELGSAFTEMVPLKKLEGLTPLLADDEQ